MADISSESHDITADLIEQTPIEKCSLNPRRGRNSRRLLTGFIIYASEARKEVVEKYPNENFGFISKLVGDKWRALSTDLRFQYHQRALIHNKRIKELAAREGVSLGDIDLANGSVIKAPKPTKNKSKKAGKEGKNRLNDISNSSKPNQEKSSLSPDVRKQTNEVNQYLEATTTATAAAAATTTTTTAPRSTHTRLVATATQTPPIRFIEPPPKKILRYSDAFLKCLEARGILPRDKWTGQQAKGESQGVKERAEFYTQSNQLN